MRLALGLAYDGTDFHGYQTQPSGQSVQDHLERALAYFLALPASATHLCTTAAGRTDAGVHAQGQVVHLDTEADRPAWNWVRGLNSALPPTIRVRWAARVEADFHARFHATQRHYTYRIINSPVDDPLRHRYATWVFQPLNAQAMHDAAQCLLGEHDFTSFRAAECQANSPVRRLDHLSVQRQDDLITLRISGNAFLHHMVRNIVGSLVEVGRGAQPATWIAELLQGRNRSLAARTFPAQGLCLAQVTYPKAFECEPESNSAA